MVKLGGITTIQASQGGLKKSLWYFIPAWCSEVILWFISCVVKISSGNIVSLCLDNGILILMLDLMIVNSVYEIQIFFSLARILICLYKDANLH